MRIVVHDYAGHPFQIQLSRELASRGHDVRHIYAASIQTPRGGLARRPVDPHTFSVEGIALTEQVAKYSFLKRRVQERRYAKLLVDRIRRFAPDVVISSNTPPDAQAILQRDCRREGIGFVFWLQDVFGVGVERVLRKKLPILGRPIAWYYARLEQETLARSDAVVVITDDFLSVLDWRKVVRERVHVIPNWAPLDEVPQHEKDNEWARQHELDDKRCFVYSGTLGLKHNPGLLLALARRFRNDPQVRIVVVSEGLGADWLEKKRREHDLENLVCLPFQAFEVLPRILATADVLVAILEPDAGVFSVPSKVLTYLCAGRPLLLAVPAENLAARIVERNGAGVVVAPTDEAEFIAHAEALITEADGRRGYGDRARAYAEKTFDIQEITTTFEMILSGRLSRTCTGDVAPVVHSHNEGEDDE